MLEKVRLSGSDKDFYLSGLLSYASLEDEFMESQRNTYQNLVIVKIVETLLLLTGILPQGWTVLIFGIQVDIQEKKKKKMGHLCVNIVRKLQIHLKYPKITRETLQFLSLTLPIPIPDEGRKIT